MGDTITITGLVGTEPAARTTSGGAELVTFRLASPIRRQDKASGTWVETGTSWYTVTAWRQLAKNVIASVRKGERVIVVGDLRIRSYERQDGTSGIAADLDARALGHDLLFQTTTAERTAFERRPEAATGVQAGDRDAVGAAAGDSSPQELAAVGAAPSGAGAWGAPGGWAEEGGDPVPF